MTWTEHDHQAMALALALAAKGRGWVEPNPMVGAVVVDREGTIIASGRHERHGGPHAEVLALGQAGQRAHGATLYVTLEPCCHHGKTPPCTDLVTASGVARVVAAMSDPFPEVSGRGLAILEAAGIDVAVGLMEEAARVLNAPYLKRLTTGRPHVLAKWAMTLDGKAATASGDSRWISGEASRAMVHETRGVMDAILVGLGTVLADDPELTARPPGARVPIRIVLDSQAATPHSCRLVQSARQVPLVIAVNDHAPPPARERLSRLGAEILSFPGRGRIPIGELLDELGRRGHSNLLVEGGGTVLGSFLEESAVDAVDVYLAPVIEGGDHARSPARGRGLELMRDATRLERVQTQTLGDDIRVQGWIPQPWRSKVGL